MFLTFSNMLVTVSKTKPGIELQALVQQPGKRGVKMELIPNRLQMTRQRTDLLYASWLKAA